MKQKFFDARLVALNDDVGFADDGMRRALCAAMQPGERAIASYNVSAHVWIDAVLTDRSLLVAKGAVRAKVIRIPLSLEVTRAPSDRRTGVGIRTPLGKKTLWGSKLDPEGQLLLSAIRSNGSVDGAEGDAPSPPAPVARSSTDDAASCALGQIPDLESDGDSRESDRTGGKPRLTRAQARRAAGPRPHKPRRRRVRRQRVGFAPAATVWELADRCIKCGRPLTDPRSRRARVGTKCIRIWGSQQRRIPNPEHERWVEKKTRADVAYLAEKARVDAEFDRAKTAYDEALAAWMRVRSRR